jgi:hypothetical protein
VNVALALLVVSLAAALLWTTRKWRQALDGWRDAIEERNRAIELASSLLDRETERTIERLQQGRPFETSPLRAVPDLPEVLH